MSYIGIPPQANFSSGLLDRFTSTTGTTVTLTHDIASENDIVVFVNFVKQDSTTYSVGGTGNKTLTLGGTLVSSDIVEVHYLNIVGQTNAPSSGSVGSSQLTTGAVTGAKLNADVISSQTELASAPDSTDELLISDAGVLKRVDVSLVGGTNTPSFQAFRSSNQSIGHASATKIQFNTEVFDSDNAYDNSSNFRFTVPSGQAGKYYLYAQVRPNTTTDIDTTHIYIYKNGSERLQSSGRSEYYETLVVSGIDDLSAGDYIEVYYYQGSGGSIDASGNASVMRSTFGAFKLIGA